MDPINTQQQQQQHILGLPYFHTPTLHRPLQVRVEESGSMTSQLSVSTFYGLIKLLATCAAGSHVVAESLLQV